MNPEEVPVWIPFLRRASLFRDLSDEDLARIAALLKPLSLPRGAALFSAGDPGDSFYLISSGQVRLVAERGGRETVLAFLGRGDVLGELSLLTGEPRPATARVDSGSEFLVLSRADFEEACRGNPAVMFHVSRAVARGVLAGPRPGQAAAKPRAPRLLAVLAAMRPEESDAFHLNLASALLEQARGRVLVVDLGPACGSVARSLGLKPVLTSEAMLRQQDLRDPEVVERLVTEHPCGLRVLSLPAPVLGGRLYRGIFLLMNLLRERHDFVLACLGPGLGDVERSILDEADGWVLAGSAAGRQAFRALGESLAAAPAPEGGLLRVWLGDHGSAEAGGFAGPGAAGLAPAFILPWPDELAAGLERGEPPELPADRFPRTRRGLRRLARRLARLSVGLAMGSGAALGYSLIGVLKGLRAGGIELDLVAGTSMGAVVGGLFAMGLEPEEIEDLAARVDKAWVYENLFRDLTVPRAGLFAGATLLRFLRSHFGEKRFEDLELPFACVAADIETGEAVVLKDGPVAEAVRASCGIPMLFAPIFHRGRFLVDGGLVDPVPTRVLSRMGADILIGANLIVPARQRKSAVRDRYLRRQSLLPVEELSQLEPLKELGIRAMIQSPNLFEILLQTIYTMEYEIAASRLHMNHVLIQPDLGNYSWTEMHRAREIVDAGRRAAEEAVPKIKALLPFFASG